MNIHIKISTAFAAIAFLLPGCSTLSRMQDPIAKLNKGAHAAEAAQTTFYNDIHNVECDREFFLLAQRYASDKQQPIDLRGKCKGDGFFLTSAQIKAREQLFATITLYTDKLQVIAAGDDEKDLDSNLQDAAKDLNQTASAAKLSGADSSITTGAEAAVVAITNMILDRKKAVAIQAAAAAQQQNLIEVIKALKSENTNMAMTAENYVGEMRASLTAQLALERQRELPVAFHALFARDYLLSTNPFENRNVEDASVSPTPTQGIAQELNNALAAILAANQAIANANDGGTKEALKDLYSRVKAARDVKAAIGD